VERGREVNRTTPLASVLFPCLSV